MSSEQEKRIFHRLRKHNEEIPPSKGAQGDDQTPMQRMNEDPEYANRMLALIAVHSYMQQAQMYSDLFDEFNPQTSEPVEYLNRYHRVDRIWQELQDGREPGEGNDEILDAWERVHQKACDVYSQLKNFPPLKGAQGDDPQYLNHKPILKS